MSNTETVKYVFALTGSGKRIHISDAGKEKEEYRCPVCGGKMIAKKGKIKRHHFAHRSLTNCDEWYGNKGDWHISMQDMFPRENQEVVIVKNGEKHIADVCLYRKDGKRLVVEFQNSPMTHDEFVKRTSFYKAGGNDMIWVFNAENEDIRYKGVFQTMDGDAVEIQYSFSWKRPLKALGEIAIVSTPILLCVSTCTYPELFGNSIFKIHAYLDILPIYLERVREGYGIYRYPYQDFKGEIVRSLKDYVMRRLEKKTVVPFIEYDSVVWLKYPTVRDFMEDRQFFHKGQCLSCDTIDFRACIFIEENRSVLMTSTRLDEMKREKPEAYRSRESLLLYLVEKLGSDNVKVLPRDRTKEMIFHIKNHKKTTTTTSSS